MTRNAEEVRFLAPQQFRWLMEGLIIDIVNSIEISSLWIVIGELALMFLILGTADGNSIGTSVFLLNISGNC